MFDAYNKDLDIIRSSIELNGGLDYIYNSSDSIYDLYNAVSGTAFSKPFDDFARYVHVLM